MDHIIDLEYLQQFGNEAVLEALYEHACELQIVSLIDAIDEYWKTRVIEKHDKDKK